MSLATFLDRAAAQHVLPTIAASGILSAQAGAPGRTAVKASHISSGRLSLTCSPQAHVRLARELQRHRT